jgi:hypothetical protein
MGCRGARASASSSASAARFSVSVSRSEVIHDASQGRSRRRCAGLRGWGRPGRRVRRRRPGMSATGLGHVDRHDVGLLPERRAEPEPEVHGNPTTSARSAPLSPCERARAKNSSWSAGTQPRASPLRNTGCAASRRGQQLRFSASPVEVRPGHDHGALGPAQQRDGALERLGSAAPAPRPAPGAAGPGSGSSASMNT